MGGSSVNLLDRFQMQLAGPVSRAKNPIFSLFLDTKRATVVKGRRQTREREREGERDLEREERWRDLGGSVCLPPVSLLLLLLYLCHKFSETHLVSFGGVLLFFGWFFCSGLAFVY